MKRLVFAFALLALLAAPAPAMAKGPTTATLCGPEGCEASATHNSSARLPR